MQKEKSKRQSLAQDVDVGRKVLDDQFWKHPSHPRCVFTPCPLSL